MRNTRKRIYVGYGKGARVIINKKTQPLRTYDTNTADEDVVCFVLKHKVVHWGGGWLETVNITTTGFSYSNGKPPPLSIKTTPGRP